MRADCQHQFGKRRLSLVQFNEALSDFTRAMDLKPDYHLYWVVLAQFQLYLGYEDAYRETARQMLLRFPKPERTDAADRIAKTYALVKPYLVLGEKLGRLVSQLAPKRNDQIVVTYGGNATELPTDPITRIVLIGFLETAGGQEVNQVNVRTLAASLGLLVEEIKSNEDTDYNEAITKFTTLQTALQANLQTAGRTLNLSLLDFLG